MGPSEANIKKTLGLIKMAQRPLLSVFIKKYWVNKDSETQKNVDRLIQN